MAKGWYTKRYQVIYIDEWNNMYEIGWFDTLREAEPIINNYIKDYILNDGENDGKNAEFGEDKPLGELKEYPSTYGFCFDKEIYTESGCLQVRGFVRENKTSSKENSRTKTLNRLKDCSMDLYDWELCLSNAKINKEGKFDNKIDELLYTELLRTRKHIESLLFLLEKYMK